MTGPVDASTVEPGGCQWPRRRAPFAVRKIVGHWHVLARWQRTYEGSVLEEGEADLGPAYSWQHAVEFALTPPAFPR